MPSTDKPFWQSKTLEQMNANEWEQLCDRCGLCCLVRVEDEDTTQVYETNIICAHYDCDNKCCTSYDKRQQYADGCKQLTLDDVANFEWLPNSCAYRLIDQGKPLPSTHPLVSKSYSTTETVVELFEPVGLLINNPDIDPAQHLILKD